MKTLASLLVSLVTAASAFGQTAPPVSQIFDFSCNKSFSSCPQGFDPTLSPVQLSNGNFYGVTWWAGTGSSSNGGTVWKATLAGKVTALHTFAANSAGKFSQGENPVMGFAVGADGNLYGTTESGGSASAGVFYKLTPSGTFTVLHNFCTVDNCADVPGPIILGQDRNFYGVVRESTTIFKLTPKGVWSSIFTLPSGTLGGSLVQGSDGTFYGTGVETCDAGFVFSLTPGGIFTILHSFDILNTVSGNIVLASDGNIYGVMGSQVFQLTTAGGYTVIYELSQAQGPSPSFLTQASDGNLWGLSPNGGTAPDRPGTLFTLTTSGTFISSEEFNCSTTGCNPLGMVEGSDGNFYGNAATGGNAPGKNPEGTFFKVAAGLTAK
jgi:uncharacterized repeat protein (TIGR03803 family)